MMNFHFQYVPKTQMDSILPALFDILYNNMSKIAPSGRSRDDEFAEWFKEVSPAMQKEARQIVLMLDCDVIAGYFQYYTTADKLMMEEIQIKEEYQGSGLFRLFYSWLVSQLPREIKVVEAYSHENNVKSQSILEHLGLEKCGMNNNYNAYHYKGDYANLLKRYLK